MMQLDTTAGDGESKWYSLVITGSTINLQDTDGDALTTVILIIVMKMMIMMAKILLWREMQILTEMANPDDAFDFRRRWNS